MYRHILLPIDGSKITRHVAREGMRLAREWGAQVTALHVIPAHFGVHYGGLSVIDRQTQNRLRKLARAEGTKYLERIAAAAAARGVSVECLLIENDDPWKGIVATARKRRCDVIVMAAHGRQGLSAWMIGSQTNKVLANSRIPVLVYR